MTDSPFEEGLRGFLGRGAKFDLMSKKLETVSRILSKPCCMLPEHKLGGGRCQERKLRR